LLRLQRSGARREQCDEEPDDRGNRNSDEASKAHPDQLSLQTIEEVRTTTWPPAPILIAPRFTDPRTMVAARSKERRD
jgi:hypothetical protein